MRLLNEKCGKNYNQIADSQKKIGKRRKNTTDLHTILKHSAVFHYFFSLFWFHFSLYLCIIKIFPTTENVILIYNRNICDKFIAYWYGNGMTDETEKWN